MKQPACGFTDCVTCATRRTQMAQTKDDLAAQVAALTKRVDALEQPPAAKPVKPTRADKA
jgi:hypothetical protein